MKMKVQAPKTVEEGKHTGRITGLRERTDPYEYTDLLIEIEDGIKLAVGYPTFLSPTSKLGQLLARFGVELKIDAEIDLEAALVGKACRLITVNKKTPTGTWPNVIADSVAPAPN